MPHKDQAIPKELSFGGENLTIQDHRKGAPDTTEVVDNSSGRVDGKNRVGGTGSAATPSDNRI